MLAIIVAVVTVAVPTVWLPVAGIAIPVLTALVTKYRADSSRVHAVVALVASGLVVVVQSLLDSTPDTATSLFISFLMVFGPALGSYVGIWEPFDINKKLLPAKGI